MGKAGNILKAPLVKVEKLTGLGGPASLVLISAVIGALIVLFPADIVGVTKNGAAVKVQISFWERLWAVLLTQLHIAFILIYSFQCFSSGHCYTWAWGWAIFLFVLQVLTVVGLLMTRGASFEHYSSLPSAPPKRRS